MTDFNAFPKFVAIVGSRTFPHQHWVVEFVKRLQPDTVIISGGARGVDSWAVEAAEDVGMPTKEFLVEDWEWEALGKRAGRIRNETMAKYIDEVKGHLVAFATVDENDMMTKGTKHMIQAASRYNIPMTIFNAQGDSNGTTTSIPDDE